MLEQAIVDAKALREAALKNAEQAVIEKYAPEIKSAVESLLNEASEESAMEPSVEPPYAAQPQTDSEQEVEMSFDFEFNPEDFQIDLEDLKAKVAEDPSSSGEQPESPEETLGDLDLGGTEEGGEDLGLTGDEELQLQELLNMLSDAETKEVVEEELTVDVSSQKDGWNTTDAGARGYDQELELAQMESTKWKEENEALVKRIKELQKENKNFANAVLLLNEKLNESTLSNAKLVYSNKTLGDASLNERQKIKIVEAIATAKTAQEAKSLYETLKTTVGSETKKAPKSLSESVNRKSNLSAILPRRKQAQQTSESNFSTRMQKLAGIK
tara:strand:- start:635 stop:1618 length:984 start_codon:yes stop_codon:yes gene_type:complete